MDSFTLPQLRALGTTAGPDLAVYTGQVFMAQAVSLSCSTPAKDETHWNVGRKNLESWVRDFKNSIPPNKINKPKTVAQSERENAIVFMNC